MSKLIARFAKDESGATAIEYGLLAALIAVAVIAAVGNLSDGLKSAFQNLGDNLTDHTAEMAPAE